MRLTVPFHVVLLRPEIPPNTGNVIRLCANTGARLHLVRPLGFELEDRRLRRAGLDYHEWAQVAVHEDLDVCLAQLAPARVFAFTTRASHNFADVRFERDDALVFGPETRGLPDEVLASVPAERRLRIPMVAESRSLNLSNAVAVAVFEAWRQLDYTGAAP
ncbi:MAG: tRNA (uridine(34)/cytosine(34)/5-carboxymethylaminomethyluridine(34)-2'-O)-methyltransferase TrmL [Pseudomonadota bacterium]